MSARDRRLLMPASGSFRKKVIVEMIYNYEIHILDIRFGLHYTYCLCFILFIYRLGQNLVKDDDNKTCLWRKAKRKPLLEPINHL